MSADDLIARLREGFQGDHDRGCEGRQYTCSCGYDERLHFAAEEAAATIASLKEENAKLREEAARFAEMSNRDALAALRLESERDKLQEENDRLVKELSRKTANVRDLAHRKVIAGEYRDDFKARAIAAESDNEALRVELEQETKENAKLKADLAFADEQSAFVEAIAEPNIKWECASDGCNELATVRFERGGVGSYYCHECYMRICALQPDAGKEKAG